MTHAEWIKQNYPGSGGYGNCKGATALMVEAFPDLRRARGHYYCPAWGPREHWWCVREDGEIVDPTAGQFPSKGHGHYEEWDSSQPEPTGKCPECGAYAYDGNTFCSDGCDAKYMAYLNGAPL